MVHKMMRREIKLFDILEDMRKAFPAYADALGKEFDDDTVIVRKAGPAETVDVQPGEHVIVGRISTIAVDTYQEVVLPEGMNKSSYEKNPVVLFGHNYLDFLPHGENVWLTPYPRKKPHEVRAATKYYQDQERGRDIYSHREQKRPLGYSIGYIPLKDITPADDDWKETLEMWQDRYAEYKGGNVTKKSIPKPRLITKDWILLEYSDVVVPANPDAVQIYVEKGFITPDEIPEYTIDSAEDMKEKGVTPHVSLTLMPEDAAWNPGGVPDSQIIEAILGRDPADGEWTAQMNANYKKVNCWWDGTGGKIDAFKLKIGRRDPITGKSAPLKYNWHQTANRMAILMGGRGGVDIPDADRKPVYDRLVKVYKMFDKEPPEFKEYRAEAMDIISLALKYDLEELPVNWDLMDKLEPELRSWKDTLSAFHQGSDDFDLGKILDEIEDDDIDLNPQEIAGLVVGSIKDIFKPSGKSSKAGDPPLADDDFNLDELPTPEELMQLKKGKVL